MDDLYVENFFQRHSQATPFAPTSNVAVTEITEESVSQLHFHLRVLKEEISKQLGEMPPFPLMLEKLEKAVFSKNEDVFHILDDLEEFLDLQYLYQL